MDDFTIFWGMMIFIAILLFIGIPFLIFFILRRFGQPKIGKIIGIGVLAILTLFTTYIVFEDHFFFKSTARNKLKQADLILNDDFKIINNESGGFTDFYQIFELKISDNDFYRLTENYRSANKTIIISHKTTEEDARIIVKVNKENKVLTFEYYID